MIKRKLISSALILALVMTVAGCGNAKNKSNSEQNNSQIAQETTQAAAISPSRLFSRLTNWPTMPRSPSAACTPALRSPAPWC